jgi:type I restriction enzyme S subunit
MKKYEFYRDSGVETIGLIPSNWNVLSIRHIAEIVGRIGFRGYTVEDIVSEGEGAISLSPSNILDQKLDLKKKTFLSWDKYEESPEIKINEGDVILVKTASVGKVAYVDNLKGYKATLNPQLIVFKNIKLNSKYFYYLLISEAVQKKIESDTNGGVVGTLTQKSINSYQILRPTDNEQIPNFLDHKTAIIEALIEKKEQLIQKLQAQRQAIINEAVTKGLNSNAKMKDSGIEWLGEIPEHWEVKSTKYLLNEKDGIKIGPFGSALKLDTLVEKGVKIYGQGNVIKDDFKLGHRYLPLDRFEESFQQYEILDGDILVTMMGTTGKSKVFNNSYERGILDSHLLRLRFDENLFNGYLFSIILQQADYIFQQINFNSVGSIMAGLNSAIIKKIKIVTPPLKEQLEVLDFINSESNKIDLIIKKSNTQIKKLKSYRQSIISEAVTGKIDVRDWQTKTTQMV